ncbi:DASH family cryptochrome [Microbulbifer flavimaris]|uniref:Cryptochrome DASH n=1 Tax=Microbulbifer flavimaris TaxID=1781068 RepID=A0ABX4I2U7_9GAMM|nr:MULTISPECIES: DASH family cryptochrome [Microbulbifer]KUJ83686.1 deoxyribodipyrimidine photolyase [Microbulbifer sp. ZGT114]PCO05854.1 DASH family cryptochrome [Microbulbifer flavimaris]
MNLVWYRNNLRSIDNQPLVEACQSQSPVVALYCFDPRQFEKDRYGFMRTGKFRARFLIESVQTLRQQLAQLNIPLLIYREKPESILPRLVQQLGVEKIFLQREWTRDEEHVLGCVRRAEGMSAVEFYQALDQFLLHPDDVSFAVPADVPRVFTKFRKHVEKELKVRKPLSAPLPRPTENLASAEPARKESSIPDLEGLGLKAFTSDPRSAFPFRGGELAAQERIDQYFWQTENLRTYKHTRNGLVGTEYSSKLSPWLANGSLSARQVYWQVKEFERQVVANEDTYWLVFELLWRDFFKYVSLKHGDRIFQLGGILQKDYEWQHAPAELQRWINGETEYDFVNANMREIAATGWMSNRGRQNVASYFARERQQDWRTGAAYFESLLLDYDVHSNYGNWMYNSGVGNDPRDRHFNINSQAERYDPEHAFRNLWLKESNG